MDFFFSIGLADLSDLRIQESYYVFLKKSHADLSFLLKNVGTAFELEWLSDLLLY